MTPLEIDAGIFSNRENACLYVPEGSVETYSKADIWKDFLSIKRLSDPEMYSGGDGTESNPYIINTVGDMKVLAKNVNGGTSYEGVFFKVAKQEIDFANVTYVPIGNTTGINQTGTGPYYLGNPFSGTLDGNGVIIKNLSSDNGLFRNLGKNGVVKDVIIDESCIIIGKGNVGGIAGVSEGAIINCTNRAEISSMGYHIGGICGDNMGNIIGCKNYGIITGKNNQDDSYSGSMIGGIAGDSDGGHLNNLHNVIIKNSENYGVVSGTTMEVGGIVGLATGNGGLLEGCSNKGNIIGRYRVGGIVGNNTNPTMVISNNIVTNCIITGTDASSSSDAGAITPTCYGKFSNNYYTTDVILKVGDQTYDGNTPRGIWGYDTSISSYVPQDVIENCAAMLLIKGDASGDYFVNAEDVVKITDYMMGKEPGTFSTKAADMNGDNLFNIADIIQIVNLILSKE